MPRRASRKGPAKIWYQVYAVDIFPNQWIGETPASDPAKLIDRNVEVVVRDITGDFMHEKHKLWFKIFKVEGNKAYARFIKEMLNRDYMRSIVQRRSSRIDVQSEGVTKDGNTVRIFTLIVSAVRVKSSQKSAIRKRADEYIRSKIPEHTVEELVKSYIFGEPVPILSEIQKISSKIAPIKYIELRKMVVLKPSEGIPTEVEQEVEGSASSGGGG